MSNDVRDSIKVVLRLKPVPQGTPATIIGLSSLNEVHVHPTESSATATLDSYEQNNRSLNGIPASSLTNVKRFTFDAVFDQKCTQVDVFNAIGSPIVDQVMSGYNATVLSYGQTGSGKTHTMIGPQGGSAEMLADPANASLLGVVPRLLSTLFSRLQTKKSPAFDFSVTLGVVELYNEALRDLTLNGTETTPPELKIREDSAPGGKGIYIEGMSHHDVSDAGAALEVIKTASARKVIGATRMNESSSRSHTIVIVNMTQIDHVKHDTKTNSQVFLVDLAGSERVDKTGAMGDRLREAQNINLSLTLLGNVISKLTDGKSLHIPYRDAKLTRLLQDSLGGNAVTTLICACSVEKLHAQETLSTIQFAQRAKSIKNQPVANVVRGVEELNKELLSAKEEIKALSRRLQLRDRFGDGSKEEKDDEDLQSTVKSLLTEIEQLKEELRVTQQEKTQLEDTVAYYTASEERTRKEIDSFKMQSMRDRAAAESALEKLTELLSRTRMPENTTLSEIHTSPSLTLAGSKRGAPRPPAKRSTSSAGLRGGSQREQSMPSNTSPECGLDSNPGVEYTSIKADAQALVRERMLLSQLDQVQKDLAEHKKFAVLVDRERSENEDMKVRHNRHVEELTNKYEALLSRQDAELSESKAELKKLQEQVDSLQKNLEEERSKASALEEGVNRDVSATHSGFKADIESLQDARLKQWVLRLENENKELHTENRINAMRMTDLSKTIDNLQTENKRLQDDRETMRRDIEMHSMEDGVLKKKLLSMLTKSEKDKQQERSYFRKRLLECFSSD